MTFWLLASLFALVSANGRLSRIVLSAIAFGLAFWSKEIAAVFLPGMLFLAYVRAHPVHRAFAVSLWTAATATAVSLFAVLALLKDELLPPGVLWSSEEEHVSLWETFSFQAQRGGNGSVFNPESNFRVFFGQWTDADPFLLIGGLVAAALGFLFWRRDKAFFGVSLMTLSFMLLLVRGGVVLHFYVIPLLALLALALGFLAGHLAKALAAAGDNARGRGAAAYGFIARFASSGRPAALAIVGLAVFLFAGATFANAKNFTGDATSSQSEATRWIADNVPNESVLIMDAYPWADLRDEALVGDEPFDNAHYYLPATQDPAVRDKVLGNDPRNIDYMLHSPTTAEDYAWIDGDIAGRKLSLVPEARQNADRIQLFTSEDWQMELLRERNLHQVEASDNPLLENSWKSYRENFVEDGRVVDPKADGLTTSEGQAYAMLRAVYVDDREAFDEVWGWTKENLQVREDDALLAWKYGETGDGSLGVTDESSAADADTDAALALLFASKQFDDPRYEAEAQEILTGIWETETAEVDGERVVVAGDWARGDGGAGQPVVNPSYLAPYAYRIFAEADPSRPWGDLVDSTYGLFDSIRQSSEFGGEVGAVPDWVALDPGTGDLSAAEDLGPEAANFSYDASRVPWRLTLDYLWFTDDRALEAVRGLDLPRREIEQSGKLLAAYNTDNSEPAADHEATSVYCGVLPGLILSGNPDLAHKTYAEKILQTYNDGPGATDAYWGEDQKDYYAQNTCWFGASVMEGSMSNLWAGESTINWDEASISTRFSLEDRNFAEAESGRGAGLRLSPEEERRLEEAVEEPGAIARDALDLGPADSQPSGGAYANGGVPEDPDAPTGDAPGDGGDAPTGDAPNDGGDADGASDGAPGQYTPARAPAPEDAPPTSAPAAPAGAPQYEPTPAPVQGEEPAPVYEPAPAAPAQEEEPVYEQPAPESAPAAPAQEEEPAPAPQYESAPPPPAPPEERRQAEPYYGGGEDDASGGEDDAPSGGGDRGGDDSYADQY